MSDIDRLLAFTEGHGAHASPIVEQPAAVPGDEVLADLMGEWASDPDRHCVGADIEIFFPESPDDAAEAKAICFGCPVQSHCLDWALRHEDTGIWAGTTETERRRMRWATRRRKSQAGRKASSFSAETTRRQHVRRWLAEGRDADEIAAELGLPSAAHVHRLLEGTE